MEAWSGGGNKQSSVLEVNRRRLVEKQWANDVSEAILPPFLLSSQCHTPLRIMHCLLLDIVFQWNWIPLYSWFYY